MRKNISRGRLIFTCIWLGIFAVAYVVWAFYLSAVSSRLTEYENQHPEHAAQRVFDEYFLNADPMSFSSYDDVETRYDVRGSSMDYYYALTYGKVLAFSEIGKEDGAAVYEVTADGEQFANIVLSRDDSGAWRLKEILLTARPSYEIYINAPKSAVVTVNGVLLDGSCAVSEYLLDDAPVFEGDSEKRAMVTYRLSGLYAEPTLSVKLTESDVQLGLDEVDGSTVSAEKTYVAYLSRLYYGNN